MRLFHFLISGILCLTLATPAAAEGLALARCGSEIGQILSSLEIPEARMRDVNVLNIYGASGNGGRIDHVEGWVSFNDCRGNLVISVTTACYLKDIYTTYECRVPGIKSY
jgi:hypothetical protein|tara:strand:- start:8 stop:337 length:330 start_codon:yes stop_codon:yes gene_type:complete